MLESIIYKYLKFEWTYSYIERLQSFAKKINTREKKVTKLAPNKITRRHLPKFFSLVANISTKIVQKETKFYVDDYFRTVKIDLFFTKGHKLIFRDKVFGIVAIPTKNPGTTVSMKQTRKKPAENFNKNNIVSLESKHIGTKMDNDEITIHLISDASMDYLSVYTLAVLDFFSKEKYVSMKIGVLLFLKYFAQ